MADEIKNYSNIEIPYDDYLSRGNITTPEGSLDSSNGSVENQPVKEGGAMGDLWIRNFIRSNDWSPKKRGFTIDGRTGYAEFMNVFISGNVEATTGTIGGFTINATSLTATSGGNTTIVSSGATAFSAGPTGSPTITITQAGLVTASNVSITGGTVVTSVLSGTIAQANLNLADRGWTQTSAFSVTDADTIAWGTGTFTSADGTAYSIGAGNTGNMVAKTYIYLDIAVSTVAYQITTTATTAVGVGKVLIAIAQNGTNEATYKVLQGQGGENIDAANIVAGSITANEIAASTITAGKMSVSQLSAIAADLGAITAGTIVLPSGGLIRSGQTSYDTGTGWWLGNASGTPKFSIGNSAGNKLTWDGTTLGIQGDIETASSGYRLIMSSTNNAFEFRSGSTLLSSLKSKGVPYSGLAGVILEHGTGELGLQVTGNGVGGGTRNVAMTSGDGTNFLAFIDHDDGTWSVQMSGVHFRIPVGTNLYLP